MTRISGGALSVFDMPIKSINISKFIVRILQVIPYNEQ